MNLVPLLNDVSFIQNTCLIADMSILHFYQPTTEYCDCLLRLGAHYRSGYIGTEQDFSVAEIIIHPQYNKPKEYGHDIALLRLNRPARLTKHVGTVCLGEPAIELNSGKNCWISGKEIDDKSLSQ